MAVHILLVVMFLIFVFLFFFRFLFFIFIIYFCFFYYLFLLCFFIRFPHEYCCPMNKREQHTLLSQNHSCVFFNVHDTTQTYGQLT